MNVYWTARGQGLRRPQALKAVVDWLAETTQGS